MCSNGSFAARSSQLQVVRFFFTRLTLVLRDSFRECALAAALLLIPAGVVLAVSDSHSFVLRDSSSRGTFVSLLPHILMTNLSSALFLFSGTLTLGVTSAIGCVIVGLFLGFSVNAAIGTLGVEQVIAQTWFYTPFEVCGFVLAGASGLVSARYVLIEGKKPLCAYRIACPRSLILFAYAVIFLIVAAILEAAITV